MQSLRVGLRGLDPGGGRDRRRDGQLLIIGVGDRAGGVRCGHRGLLRAQQHLGAHVLDGLEAADRLAELFANLRVFGGGPQHPAGQSGGLGRQHRGGEVVDPLPRHRQHLGGRGLEHHAGQRAGEVGGSQRLDDHTVGGRVDQQKRVAGGQQQHPGFLGAQHKFGGARRPAVLVSQVRAQRDAGGALTRRQRLQHVGMGAGNDERGQRRGGNRAGHQRGGGLVDHRAQVIGAAPGAAQPLGDRDAEDP